MKKRYKIPALRKLKIKSLALLAGSLSVESTKGSTQQYSKESSIFDSVFSPKEEEE